MSTKSKVTSRIVIDNLREYGFYTLEDRALADARDGLKPVQRRLLWSLHKLKRHSKAIPVKCATVVGDTMGCYHPHGDAAIYGALVTLSWLRKPLVQQHGNFGDRSSLLEAPPADHRYTETQLTEFADRSFDDIAIMPMVKSFTEEHDEPFLLPTRAPLLVVHGCVGVALGLATHIPPHNLTEALTAALEVLENPDCTTDDLLKYIKGPDYGSGVLLSKKADLRTLYETGRGRLQFACSYHFEDGPSGNQRLVITGLNPGFKAGKLEEVTGELFAAKLLDSAANDEGSLEAGTKIVVEFSDGRQGYYHPAQVEPVVALEGRDDDAPVGFEGESVPRGSHLCLLPTTMGELIESTARYTAAGLAAGENCVCAFPPEWADRFRAAIREMGTNVDRAVGSDQLVILQTNDLYLPAAEFTADAQLQRTGSLSSLLSKRSESGCRCFGYAGTAVFELEEWWKYESRVTARLKAERVTALCGYHPTGRGTDQWMRADAVHRYVVKGNGITAGGGAS